MKWFNDWFARKCRQAWEDSSPEATNKGAVIGTNRLVSNPQFEQDGGLNIQVWKAIGGRIVTFSKYDSKLDRSNRTTYIITDDENFEQSLTRIMTLESLR